MKAKKSFGQHFLVNEDIAERISNSLSLYGKSYTQVIEVGPGKGVLTKYLLAAKKNLFAVEADRDMVQFLHRNYPELADKLIPGDFLKVPLEPFIKNEQFAIIGNFPYNISSQILFRMLEFRSQVPELVGMFQKEVGERVVSDPGSKVYGVISVLIQAYYKGEYLFTVSNQEFAPPPKVQSCVIRLTRRQQPLVEGNEKIFRQVVKTAFSQRRKMLRNTLKGLLAKSNVLHEPLFQKRPEQLSVEEFVEIAKLVEV